jgi:homospermidine synthase
LQFQGKVLIIGYGAVAKCTLPILLNHITIPYAQITILDFEDKTKELQPWTEKGIRFFQRKITPETLDSILSEYLDPGGSFRGAMSTRCSM